MVWHSSLRTCAEIYYVFGGGIFMWEEKIPLTLVYIKAQLSAHFICLTNRNQSHLLCSGMCISCAFVEVQPLIYGASLVSAWQLNTSPLCQTNGSRFGERGRLRPKLQQWVLFDSCSCLVIIPPAHSRIFGLPKVFLSLSLLLYPRSFPLSVSGLWLAVVTEPSLGCQPPRKLSLITPFH